MIFMKKTLFIFILVVIGAMYSALNTPRELTSVFGPTDSNEDRYEEIILYSLVPQINDEIGKYYSDLDLPRHPVVCKIIYSKHESDANTFWYIVEVESYTFIGAHWPVDTFRHTFKIKDQDITLMKSLHVKRHELPTYLQKQLDEKIKEYQNK